MAEDSVVKNVDDSDYELGKKYRLVDIMRQVVLKTLDQKHGLKSGELLSGEDLEQMLNVYLDKHGVWNLNINSSFYAVNLPDEILSAYVCPSDMRWPSISYNIYGTTRLAWLLMKINGVRGAAIFREVRSGFAVKYLDMSRYVNKILSLIQENEGKVNG